MLNGWILEKVSDNSRCIGANPKTASECGKETLDIGSDILLTDGSKRE